jgi:hypothetical protein
MKFFHYACNHAVDAIRRDGMVIPQDRAALPGISWFTDLEPPIKEALGLTNEFTACNKTEYKFTVLPADEPLITFWPHFARLRRIHPHYRQTLESAPGAMPAHWFVSPHAVRVVEVEQ